MSEPKFTIYGEAPGKVEITEGKPFQGKAGFVLKNWGMRVVPLLQLAAEKNQVSYRNILKCLPPEVQGRPYPKGEERQLAETHCAQYRQDDNDADVVILCGEIPQRYFFKDELAVEDAEDRDLGREVKGVGGRIGRVIEKEGRRYVFSPHPAWVLRQPSLVKHLQEALRIAVGTETVVEPELVPWNQAVKGIT
jgi:uracil-DNA glycosylase family 4